MKKYFIFIAAVLSFMCLCVPVWAQDELTIPDAPPACEEKRVGPIKALKDRIADEREAILAAEKRLRDAKKTGDAVEIAKVKQEVDQEIRARKSAILACYRQMGQVSPSGYNINVSNKKK
jgi:hypothetical protein